MSTNYKIYCNTEDKFVWGWSDTAPTTCYNNATHTVNLNSVFKNSLAMNDTGTLSIPTSIGIGQAPGIESLEVNGNTKTKGILISDTGSELIPSLRFSDSTNTGLYNSGSSTTSSLHFSTNGTEKLFISTNAISSTLPIGIGIPVPTAHLHIKAGTSTDKTAPLKFTSGSLLSIPETGAIEFYEDKYYATITTNNVRKALSYKSISGRIYVCTDTTMGDFTTLKGAIDWFNINATQDMEIILDGGHHLVDESIVINNQFYCLKISGLGSSITYIDATSSLTDTIMFQIQSYCDISRCSIIGSEATGTCTCIQYNTTANTYSEIKDFFIYGFDIGISDIIGVEMWLFDFSIESCDTGIIQDYTTESGTTTRIDAEVGDFTDCTTAINLVKGSLCDFIFMHLVFSQCEMAVKYDGSQYIFNLVGNIMNCTWDHHGILFNGFDFKRPDGRDSDIEILGNAGNEDETPHVKINTIDNIVTTTITTASTYYKLNGLNSKSTIILDTVATAGTFNIIIGDQTTDAIAYNANVTTIRTAINNLSNVTSVSVVQIVARKEWSIEFLTNGEGWVDMPITLNLSNLTGPTTYVVDKNYYICKWGITNNKITFLPTHKKDGMMWISGNLSINNTNRNANVGIKKNGTGSIISPFTIRTSVANQPYPFAINIYMSSITQGDYYELFVTSSTNGDIVTLSDLTLLIDTR